MVEICSGDLVLFVICRILLCNYEVILVLQFDRYNLSYVLRLIVTSMDLKVDL